MAAKQKKRWVEVTLPTREAQPILIVADAAIATGSIGHGRLIPLLIVDTSDRPDLEEFVRVHQHLSPGDVDIQWGQVTKSKDKIALILSFKRPMELAVILDFDILKQGGLVDQILTSNALYLQPGQDGDRFVANPNAPKVLVEVPDTGFGKPWTKMFHQRVVKDMRKRGLNRQQAKQAANQFIKEWREFGQFRMGGKN